MPLLNASAFLGSTYGLNLRKKADVDDPPCLLSPSCGTFLNLGDLLITSISRHEVCAKNLNLAGSFDLATLCCGGSDDVQGVKKFLS